MKRGLRRLVLAGAAVLLLTAVAVVAAAILMQQRHGAGRSFDVPVDAAIVLGGGVDPDVMLHYSTRRRVAVGVALLRAGLADRLVVSGGRVYDSDVAAADLMRDYALSLGAPAAAILVEGDSASTFENIRFSFALARQAGFQRLAIVTDSSHLSRAYALACYFGACDVELVAVPEFRSAHWTEIVRSIGRETLAWWYNMGKAVSWSFMKRPGVPEGRRERLVR